MVVGRCEWLERKEAVSLPHLFQYILLLLRSASGSETSHDTAHSAQRAPSLRQFPDTLNGLLILEVPQVGGRYSQGDASANLLTCDWTEALLDPQPARV